MPEFRLVFIRASDDSPLPVADSSPAMRGVGRRHLVGVAWGPVLPDVRRGSEGVWRAVRAKRYRVRKKEEERENDFLVWVAKLVLYPPYFCDSRIP